MQKNRVRRKGYYKPIAAAKTPRVIKSIGKTQVIQSKGELACQSLEPYNSPTTPFKNISQTKGKRAVKTAHETLLSSYEIDEQFWRKTYEVVVDSLVAADPSPTSCLPSSPCAFLSSYPVKTEQSLPLKAPSSLEASTSAYLTWSDTVKTWIFPESLLGRNGRVCLRHGLLHGSINTLKGINLLLTSHLFAINASPLMSRKIDFSDQLLLIPRHQCKLQEVFAPSSFNEFTPLSSSTYCSNTSPSPETNYNLSHPLTKIVDTSMLDQNPHLVAKPSNTTLTINTITNNLDKSQQLTPITKAFTKDFIVPVSSFSTHTPPKSHSSLPSTGTIQTKPHSKPELIQSKLLNQIVMATPTTQTTTPATTITTNNSIKTVWNNQPLQASNISAQQNIKHFTTTTHKNIIKLDSTQLAPLNSPNPFQVPNATINHPFNNTNSNYSQPSNLNSTNQTSQKCITIKKGNLLKVRRTINSPHKSSSKNHSDISSTYLIPFEMVLTKPAYVLLWRYVERRNEAMIAATSAWAMIEAQFFPIKWFGLDFEKRKPNILIHKIHILDQLRTVRTIRDAFVVAWLLAGNFELTLKELGLEYTVKELTDGIWTGFPETTLSADVKPIHEFIFNVVDSNHSHSMINFLE